MRTFLFLVILLLVTSCTNREAEECQQNNKMLISEIDSLKKVILIYEYAPEKIKAQAEDLYKCKNLTALVSLLDRVKKFQPESTVRLEVSRLINNLTKELEEIKAQNEKRYKDSLSRVEKERMAAVNKLKKSYDDVNGVTWYSNPYFTHYNNSNSTSLYIGKKESSTWLILKMSYAGDDWIFFENAYLSYDGNTFNVSYDEYEDKKTDNYTTVWEWLEVSVPSDLELFLREMVKSNNAKMRLSGKYTHTKKLSKTELKAIKEVLMAFDVLKTQGK